MAYSKEESKRRQSLEHSGVKEFKRAEFNLDISKHIKAFEVLGSILNLEKDKNGITFSGENQSFKLNLSNENYNNDLTIVDTNDQTIKLRLK
ncbi:MAG: hypothetical protein NXH75_12815 [Halobacteriovoraceae bacterium]|nr:hypothetical protein [Halobacteriovoraceae bacterium]